MSVAGSRAAVRWVGRSVAGLVILAALGGCGNDDPAITHPTDVVATVSSAISTVVNVRWKTSEPTVGYVEFGPTLEMGLQTSVETKEATDHAVSMLRLSPDTLYYYRVVTWDDGDAAVSETQTFRTGPLPAGFPTLTQEGSVALSNDTMIPVLGAGIAIAVLDSAGRLIWVYTEPRAVQATRAFLSVDKASVIYSAVDTAPTGTISEIVRVALDGSTTQSTPVAGLRGDFVQIGEGTVAALAAEIRDVNGTPVTGDKIVEIDSAGNASTVWTTWDCFDPALVPGDGFAPGWTAANALDYDTNENAYYIGLQNLTSIAKVKRGTPGCAWVLGETGSTLGFAPGSTHFSHQSQFWVGATQVLVIDGGPSGDALRLLQYSLDLQTNTVAQVFTSTVQGRSLTGSLLGEPSQPDGLGNILVNWAAAGQLEMIGANGARSFALSLSPGSSFGFHTQGTFPDSIGSP